MLWDCIAKNKIVSVFVSQQKPSKPLNGNILKSNLNESITIFHVKLTRINKGKHTTATVQTPHQMAYANMHICKRGLINVNYNVNQDKSKPIVDNNAKSMHISVLLIEVIKVSIAKFKNGTKRNINKSKA